MEKQSEKLSVNRNYVRSLVALLFAFLWAALSVYLALPWIDDLTEYVHLGIALYIVITLAILPGFLNMFLAFMLLFKRHIKYDNVPVSHLIEYPEIDIMIAAHNEESIIESTILSILENEYNGKVNIYCVDDASKDRTLEIIKRHSSGNVSYIHNDINLGKAKSLNKLLLQTKSEIIVTLDADSILEKGALNSIVETYKLNPNIVAVAGNIKTNTNETFIQKLQRYDYEIAIYAVKTAQSMLNGVLVAQGAFSAYNGDLLRKYTYKEDTVGEDIVITWKLLEDTNNLIIYDRNAICRTSTPATLEKFYNQRVRWARGMIEGFRSSPTLFKTRRLSSFFVCSNTLFPFLDFTYTFIFMPAIVCAFVTMHSNNIVGLWTLLIIPIGIIQNLIIAYKNDCKIDIYFIFYTLTYSFFNQSASLVGYYQELKGVAKKW